MHKVYLLLRNNHQSGPLTLDELLQNELKATDLVWEEGKSGGWSYPYEIESLKPFIKLSVPGQENPGPGLIADPVSTHLSFDMDAPFASPNIASKNVYVSLPGNPGHREEPKNGIVEESLEQKAEAIRRRALEAANHKTATVPIKPIEPDYELETKVSRTTSEIGEDYSAWLYTQKIEKKKKERKKKSIFISSSVVFIIVAGVFFFLRKDETTYTNGDTAIESGFIQQEGIRQAGMTTITPESEITSEPDVIEDPADSEPTDYRAPATEVASNTNKKMPATGGKKSTGLPTPDSSKPLEATVSNEVKPVEEKEHLQNAEENSANTDVTAAPKQKETLGNKIGNFFGKFKSKEKRDKEANEQPKTESANDERVAKKRADEGATATDLTNMVRISANTPSGNWMMGVQNLKLTLHNKSNEVLKTAVVEVRYYNEDKELLEKKVVQFNNVSPKKSQTLVAPNHRLADHADYQLISAIAKEDAIVKQ